MMRPEGSHRLQTVQILAQAVIVSVAAILLFWDLTAKDLWQDEAATAVLAVRMLKFGRPLAYDGVNLLTADLNDKEGQSPDGRTGTPQAAVDYFRQRGDFKADTTWKWQPWGLFALAGVSIKLLGQTTLAARLPFALAGLATVLVMFHLVRRQLGSFSMAAMAAILLTGNSYWILHARQCRYYSVSSLFLVLTLMAYARWQWGGPTPLATKSPAAFIALAWCWFQVDYGTVLPVLAVLFLEALVAGRRAWRRTVVAGAILAATLVPFVIFYDLLHRGSAAEESWLDRFQGNLFNTNEYVVPVLVVLAVLFVLVRNWKSLPVGERRLVSIGCAIIVALTLWIPTVTVLAFVRYVIIAAPVGAMLTAWVLVRMPVRMPVRIRGQRWKLACVAAAVLILTPWLSLPLHAVVPPPESWDGNFWYRAELQDLRTEIFGHQPDPNRLVIDWLRKNAAPTDEILIDYEDFPLMYYLPNPIRGGIATFRVEDDAIAPPRFLILRRSVEFVQWPVFDREAARYQWQPVPLKAPDVMWGNNPDPIGDDNPNAAPNLYIARRVGNP